MATRKIILTKSFQKSFKKFVGNNLLLKKNIEKAIHSLEQNIFDSTLKTHKLSGNLSGLLACTCGYDCRIVFSIETTAQNEEVILLIDIGTHDEVY